MGREPVQDVGNAVAPLNGIKQLKTTHGEYEWVPTMLEGVGNGLKCPDLHRAVIRASAIEPKEQAFYCQDIVAVYCFAQRLANSRIFAKVAGKSGSG
ncbi:hypothetical protein KSC_061980 [Ktedonobacter sp. SOSP1-52]|nr:hypothetical protein KSC_061980 [Ktedonobacter sp. SOSP1-52]